MKFLTDSFVFNCTQGDFESAIKVLCLQSTNWLPIKEEDYLVRFLLSEIIRTEFNVRAPNFAAAFS